jgi:hypothetical protein
VIILTIFNKSTQLLPFKNAWDKVFWARKFPTVGSNCNLEQTTDLELSKEVLTVTCKVPLPFCCNTA